MTRPPFNRMAAALHHGVSLCLALLLGTVVSAEPVETAGEQTLPLPRWSEQELRTFRDSFPFSNSSGALLPKNGEPLSDIKDLLQTPLSSGPRLDHFFNSNENSLSPRLRAEDLRLFLPESILGLPTQSHTDTQRTPTPLTSLREVSHEFLAACAQSLPKEYLIDPDQLVPEMQNHDMMRLLEFHAQDARIKLYVLMVGHDQTLPADAELEKVASGSLLQTDACLLVYPLGEPWRTRLFVSRSIHSQISTDFLSETIQACLHESLQTSDAHDQLRRYTIHLSTRLFWLQKALGAGLSHPTGHGQPLAEFNSQSKAAAAQSTISFSSIALWCSSSMLLLGLAGAASRRFLRHLRLKRQQRVWMLPEPETIPRLGGAFTGGAGGMIRYA
jgi:hypothetical protein